MAEPESLLQQVEAYCREQRCELAIGALQQLLSADPHNSEVHYQLGLCFSGACHPHSLTDREIALEYFRSALRFAGPTPPLLRARILAALGNTYPDSSRLPRTARLLAAIDSHHKAAEIYLAQGEFDNWARELNNLGLVECELPEEEFPNKWEAAVVHFERALGVRTREKYPRQHAATLENLGTAYRALPSGDRRGNVLRAIQCYHRAIRIYRPASFPMQNAALHNNLGNAYVSLPAVDAETRTRNARRALRHFDRALSIRTKAQHPCDYAVTQFNRGQAFLQLGGPDRFRPLEQAVACFRDAEQGFRQCGQDENAARARGLLSRIQEELALPRAA
jgi:tetratricopeptide (TPR) repeat protein